MCAQSLQGGCWLLRQAKARGEKKQGGGETDDDLALLLWRNGVRRASLPVMTMLVLEVVIRVLEVEVCARAQVVAPLQVASSCLPDVDDALLALLPSTSPPSLFSPSFFLVYATKASHTSSKHAVAQEIEVAGRDVPFFRS